ncbi:hypothetical protein VPNG_08145 [Cytospora leucostoma]|uniref:Uncharacterized protein n=1 Tax=Cytospora leucostoma TaxID=1230097 RepID=A0A423WI98_9PEZI|nr:hypothetical protein VPNG_08145 [Cytospora leucostoma]
MTSPLETGVSQSSPDMSPTIQRSGGARSRTQSVSSDRPSTVAQSVMSPPISVSPEANFIAASAASQIVSNDHDGHADTWYDQHGFQPSGDPVLVSEAALQLLNNFLDHLLFNFLAHSGSTTLPALRPAIIEVLKPKLAKDAINNADEELREYLGGDDDEDFLQSEPALSSSSWDLELIWKRTRLRCMVYSSLGDMEEEEEDHHVEEGLLGENDEDADGSVSPAVAIFLTSILEFLAEQALVSAGQAAWNRMRVKYEKEQKDGVKGRTDVVDKIVVGEVDMERVALDRTLGRLWRAWKKRIRSPGPSSIEPAQRPLSREKTHQVRRGSAAAESTVPPAVQEQIVEPTSAKEEKTQEEKAAAEPDDVQAAAIPLPTSDRDIDEIEVPGLAHYSDHDTEEEEPKDLDKGTRPRSLMLLPLASKIIAGEEEATKALQATDKSRVEKPFEDRANENVVFPEVAEVQTAGSVTVASDQDRPSIPEKNTRRQSMGAFPSVVGATLSASDTKKTENKEDADDLDYDVEEAQILTSSRISIGTSFSGRSISPADSDRSSRPALSIQTVPVRSGSLRLVDVASPRTPSSRSQRSWIQEPSNSTYSRSGDVSRTSSVRTQSNSEEPRLAEDNLAGPITGSLSKSRTGVIPEAEESSEPFSRRVLPPSVPAAVVTSRKESPRMHNLRTTSSEGRPELQKTSSYGAQPVPEQIKHQSAHSPQSSSANGPDDSQQQQLSETKSAVLTTSSVPDTILEDEITPLPQKHTRRPPRYFSPQVGTPSPPIPEETSSGKVHEFPQSGTPQPGTIGIISVDRSDMPRDTGDAPGPSQHRGTTGQRRTSGSPTSSHRLRAAHGSQDSTATRPGEVARNFEDLIQSNETIQYTLTPDSVRELENCREHDEVSLAYTLVAVVSAPRWHADKRDPDRVAFERHTPVDCKQNSRSIVEFAEFIRATGPPGADATPPAPLKRNLSMMSKRSAPAPVPSSNMSVDLGRPSMTSSLGRARLQAREATVDTGNDKSDLIDFIRRGPPSSGDHVPRTVAPFRTNMDSDHLATAGGGTAIDATLPDVHDTQYNQAAVNVTDAPSVQSSINSQSALLGKKQAPGQNSTTFDEEDMMPQRKQRRVRDPYAIDFSDEEEEDDFNPQPQPRRKVQQQKEESLMDFLNSEPPPPSSAPVPFVLPRTQSTPEQPRQAPKKKASMPGLMSRFRQNSGSGSSNGFKSPTSPARSQKIVDSRSLASRAGSTTTTGSRGYIPIQVNIPPGGDLYPSYGSMGTVPPVPTMPPNMTASRPSGRVPMKKFEPRDAVPVPSSGTSDLADFLRSSSPPPSLGQSYPTAQPEAHSGSRLFGRRKKSSGYA